MSDYDPLKVDAYATHLAEVNEKKPVIASEDIYNDQGVLIIKKGSPINGAVTQKILKFKLTQSLESSVSVQGEIDGITLHKVILAIVKKDPSVTKVHDRYGVDTVLRQRCAHYNTFNIIKQKLTVLSVRMPRVFNQSVFSAWLATLIAKQMKMSDDEMNCVFLAALTHDLGMLHIPIETIEKKGELTPEEWRQIQAHTVIGQKILENIGNIPKRVSRSVLEHHERCDGTGYPRGLFENELSLQGQIIAMCDSVIAIYWNRFRREGRSLRDLIPIIQVNSKAHFYSTYETLVTVLRKSDLEEKGVIDTEKMPNFITYLLDKNRYLNLWLEKIEAVVVPIGFMHNDRRVHAIQNVFLHVITSVRGSGIMDEGYIRWLEQVRKENLHFAYREIEDVALMVTEIEFHLKRLTRMMTMYVAKDGQSSVAEIVEQLELCLREIKKVREENKPVDPADFSL